MRMAIARLYHKESQPSGRIVAHSETIPALCGSSYPGVNISGLNLVIEGRPSRQMRREVAKKGTLPSPEHEKIVALQKSIPQAKACTRISLPTIVCVPDIFQLTTDFGSCYS